MKKLYQYHTYRGAFGLIRMFAPGCGAERRVSAAGRPPDGVSPSRDYRAMLVRLMRFNLAYGVEHLQPIHYVRYIEYALAAALADVGEGMRLLDVGSGGSLLPAFLLSLGATVYSTDIDDGVRCQPHICRLNGLLREKDLERLRVEIRDIRRTGYPEGYFDRVIMLSMVEHIHYGDDSVAMKEAARILKPGGKIFLTFDVARDAHELIYQGRYYYGFTMDDIRGIQDEVRNDPSRRLQEDFTTLKEGYNPGYTRFYNERTMMESLVAPSGLELVEHGYFGDHTFVIRAFFDRRGIVEYLHWIQPILALLIYRRYAGANELSEKPGAIGYCILQKPPARPGV